MQKNMTDEDWAFLAQLGQHSTITLVLPQLGTAESVVENIGAVTRPYTRLIHMGMLRYAPVQVGDDDARILRYLITLDGWNALAARGAVQPT